MFNREAVLINFIHNKNYLNKKSKLIIKRRQLINFYERMLTL